MLKFNKYESSCIEICEIAIFALSLLQGYEEILQNLDDFTGIFNTY